MDKKLLIRKLSRIYPKNATPFADFNGFPPGIKAPDQIDKILIALDLDLQVLKKAEEVGAQLIITHHPFIFGKRRDVLKQPSKKAIYQRLIEKNIACFALHTNFDFHLQGMNYYLLKNLGIESTRVNNSFVFVGDLPQELSLEQLAKKIIDAWQVPYVQIGRTLSAKNIKRVALTAGSGGREYPNALIAEADVFISGEFAHHIKRDCYFSNLAIIEVEHKVEKIFIEIMKKELLQISDGSLQIFTYDNQQYLEVIV